MNATPQFEQWANGYSGCDGGNREGKIWFSGIEYGGDYGDIYDEMKKTDGIIDPSEWDDRDRVKFMKYQFDRKVVKIYALLMGKDLSQINLQEFANREKVFSADSNLFKMNLYPIAFKHDGDELWDKAWFDATGLATKSLYRAWCQQNRFPMIKKWFTELANPPKLIIAAGKSYKSDFVLAFAGEKALYDTELFEEREIKDMNTEEMRKFEWALIDNDKNNDKTVLAIIPFLGGRWGVNSDDLLKAFALNVSKICSNEFGKNWLSG